MTITSFKASPSISITLAAAGFDIIVEFETIVGVEAPFLTLLYQKILIINMVMEKLVIMQMMEYQKKLGVIMIRFILAERIKMQLPMMKDHKLKCL